MPKGWVLNGRRVQGLIKRIQTGTVSAASGNATGTATILAVDLATSILIYGGERRLVGGVGGGLNQSRLRMFLTNATTVTLTRDGTTSMDGTMTMPYQVVEFWPGVLKSVQRGSFTQSGAQTTTAIAAVDTTRAMVVSTGVTMANDRGDDQLYLSFASPTAITVTAVGVGPATINYEVWEWF